MNNKIRDIITKGIYYIVIVLLSVVAAIFMPFIGNSQEINISSIIPQTGSTWDVWAFFILTITVPGLLNICLFELFNAQGLKRARTDAKYIQAMQLLKRTVKTRKYVPISPVRWNIKHQSTKICFTLLSSIAAVFMITECILNWSIQTFISTIVSLAIGIGTGIVAMEQTYDYYTSGFLEYAEYMEENKHDE